MSDSLRPRGLWPTRLPCPWDSPSKNTGVSCPLQWDLPDSGIKPWSLASPALAGRFFTTSASWEVPFWMMCVCVCVSHSVVSDSLWPYGLWPTRLLCPRDFPGKSIGAGCHFLLQFWMIIIFNSISTLNSDCRYQNVSVLSGSKTLPEMQL